MRVLINYPVVDSLGLDNRGGYSHLKANIACYQKLGYKCIVIGRFNYKRIIDNVDGSIFFNVVPGKKIPNIDSVKEKNGIKNFLIISQLLKYITKICMDLIVKFILIVFSVEIIHERFNRRYSIDRASIFFEKFIFIYEKNDEYMQPIGVHDILLSTPDDEVIHDYKLSSCWPVISTDNFDENIFSNKLKNIQTQTELSICLYGVGGIHNSQEIIEFLLTHEWLKDKNWIKLVICGGCVNHNEILVSRFEIKQVSSLLQKELVNFDLGLVFYSKEVYTDDRLRIGSPTKIHNYIDASLPFISNREYISKEYFLNFDRRELNILQKEDFKNLSDHMRRIRYASSVDLYAEQLSFLLKRVKNYEFI